MHAPLHPLDPSVLLAPLDHEHRIYLDDNAETYAIVDPEDYWFFSRWRWFGKSSGGNYPRRSSGGNNLKTGRLPTFTIYLHVAIMQRSGVIAPSPWHTSVDHRDRNVLHCRKVNLRWATTSQQNRNQTRWKQIPQSQLI